MFKPVVGMWLNLWPQNITKKVHVYNRKPIELRRLNVLLVQHRNCESGLAVMYIKACRSQAGHAHTAHVTVVAIDPRVG